MTGGTALRCVDDDKVLITAVEQNDLLDGVPRVMRTRRRQSQKQARLRKKNKEGRRG
jgi:hypothetical protein